MSESPMKKQALLIGINEYAMLPELRFARQDAEAVEQVLKQNYSFSEDEIMLLTDARPGLFKPMNKHIIQKHLENLANQELDLFIFGFWGHGLFRNGERYLCPLDVIGSAVEELGFSFSELQRLLSNIRAKNTCMILDCCQKVHDRGEEETLTAADQSIMENMARDIAFTRQKKEPEFVSNVAILNSCKEGQAAYEWDDRKHGIFTAHLLDALGRRYDSVAQIVGYVSKNVERTAMELGKTQTPLCRLEGDITLPVDNHSAPQVPQTQQQSTSESNGFKWNKALIALVVLLGIIVLLLLTTNRNAPTDRAPDNNPAPVNNVLPTSQKQKQNSYKQKQTQKQNSYKQKQTKGIEPIRDDQQTFASRGTRAGERAVVTVNGVEFAFRWCPPGAFRMGALYTESWRDVNETQHQVTLTKGFWMMETEVTQKQWKAVMGNNPSNFKGENLPVERVSWDDCQEFCKECTQLGLSVQLPTEAQWEYACRAGTGGLYAGNLKEMAWYNEGYFKGSTHPVGTKKPNDWGLYDMHGNVWEWCEDWYGNYPKWSVTDPAGPPFGDARVFRGGDYQCLDRYCKSSCRGRNAPGSRSYNWGFRCVKCQ